MICFSLIKIHVCCESKYRTDWKICIIMSMKRLLFEVKREFLTCIDHRSRVSNHDDNNGDYLVHKRYLENVRKIIDWAWLQSVECQSITTWLCVAVTPSDNQRVSIFLQMIWCDRWKSQLTNVCWWSLVAAEGRCVVVSQMNFYVVSFRGKNY